MKILICGPVNPLELVDFLNKGQDVPKVNLTVMAVNTYVKELLRQGHTVKVVTSFIPGWEKDVILHGDRLTIHIVHSNPGIFIFHGFSRLYMIPRLKKAIGLYVKDCDVIHAQWTYDFAYAAKSFSSVIPVFCTVRDWCPYILSLQHGFRKCQWYIYIYIFRKVFASDQIHFIANSDYTYNSIINAYPQKKVSVIYNPIDKVLITDQKVNILDRPVFISISGSVFEERKNILKLLEAFKLFRETHDNSILKIVGDYDGLSDEKRKDFQNKGLLQHVVFCGKLSHNELMHEIDNSSCLVHPSIEETFGNILIEGMARRVLVIGGIDAGAVPFVLDNGNCGILCDVKNVYAIKDAMERSLNKELYNSIVNKATEMINVKFRSDSVVLQHIKLFASYISC